MEMTPDDLLEAGAVSRHALAPSIARDWSVQAGDLTWDVRRTVAHVCDALGWYAARLAAQSPRRLRFDFRAHPDASNAELLDVLEAAAATLTAVARAAPPDVRAYHNYGMADISGFLAMGERRDPGPLLGCRAGVRRGVRSTCGARRSGSVQALSMGTDQ
jgi:hypothetical protein